jgi:hypothetical protein
MRRLPIMHSGNHVMDYISSNKEIGEKMKAIINQNYKINSMGCVTTNKETLKRIETIIKSENALEKELIIELKKLNFSDFKKFLNFKWSVENFLKFVEVYLWRLHFIEIQKRLKNNNNISKEEIIKNFIKDVHLLYYYKNL